MFLQLNFLIEKERGEVEIMEQVWKKKRKKEKNLSKFIDFDKNDKIFYDNLYLDEFKIVVKVPLSVLGKTSKKRIRFGKFDLVKYTYLLSYD
jgi:hypothetical protein